METTKQKTKTLEYNKTVKLEHGDVGEMRKTNEGSLSQVVIKNLSSQNTVTVSIALGEDSETIRLKPKREYFYHESPKDFDGLVLQIFNQTSSQHAGDIDVTVNGVK